MAYAAWHIHVNKQPEVEETPPPPIVIPASPPPVIVAPPTPSPPPEPESPPPPPVPVEVFAVPAVEPDEPPKVVTHESLVRIASDWQINMLQTIVVSQCRLVNL